MIQFVSVTKRGEEITLLLTAWPEKNATKVKQAAKLVSCFKNGALDSQATNELFSMMSR